MVLAEKGRTRARTKTAAAKIRPPLGRPTRVVTENSLRIAIRNVALWGDTDVLPFPIENHWFYDAEDQVLALLGRLDAHFDDWRRDYPLVFERSLSNVGYVGFRAATQIDAIWNGYFLGLAIELGRDIEQARIPKADQQVFSYRFSPNEAENTLFDKDVNWVAFQKRALETVADFRYVLSTDISDFYPRVYHHRIENALAHVTSNKTAINRIKTLLKDLSVANVSYGLPVGGNAARILAEILLNRTDRLLRDKGIRFCRFVDDYYLFADTEEDLRRSLAYLAEILLTHEGLTLSRAKTRIMSRDEFQNQSPVSTREIDSEVGAEARQFLTVRLKYDPYSPTADEDYEKLRDELTKFDVVGMLAREMRKSRVDETLVRQLIKSIRYLEQGPRDGAVQSLIDNLQVLYPVFPTIALTVKGLIDALSCDVRARVFKAVRNLIASGSHIFQVPTNRCFALRLLAYDPSEEADAAISSMYQSADASIAKRDAILAMAKKGVEHWIADTLRKRDVTPWEKRALIPASYVLGDEGKHWRDSQQARLNEVDKEFMTWVGSKNNGQLWEIPL